MNELQIFNYNNKEIRTVVKDGEAWFVAKDVAEVLGFANIREALRSLDDDEKGSVRITDGTSISGGNPNFTTVNEPGLYKLIFKSRKAEAKQFTRWVTHEVLPDIRKHGMYISDKLREAAQVDKQTFDSVVNKYLAEKERANALQEQLDADRQYTNVGKIILALPGSMSFGDAAKFYAQHGFDIGRNRLLKLARDLGLICKQKCQRDRPTQKGIKKGVVNIEIDLTGGQKFTARAMLTPEGFNELYNMLVNMQRPLEALWQDEME